MIAFGSSITRPEDYRRYAEPGIRRAAEPDSEVDALEAIGSIFRSYNLLLDNAAAREDLEALVLVHQDAEILDPDLCAKARAALADPEVGVVGCVGAVGVRSLAWWEGTMTWASSLYRYGEAGGGDLPVSALNGSTAEPHTGEVDVVEGVLLVLSPWAVRSIRFDEGLGQLHGYDVDLCLQVREAGRKVVTADLRVAHHHSLDLVTDPETWVDAHVRIAEKWEGRMLDPGAHAEDWKRRARRAEAEAAAARLRIAARQLQADARMQEGAQRRLALAQTGSWRVTEPLRRASGLVRTRRAGGEPRGGRG